MRFWDSSALVPLLVEQEWTAGMTALLAADPEVVLWWGTRVECDSAVARLERDGALAPEAASVSLARLDRLAACWHEVEPSDAVREIARRMLRTHSLRAGDALQIAAAYLASEQSPPTLPFVCLDERLILAARREGFVLVDPGAVAAPGATGARRR